MVCGCAVLIVVAIPAAVSAWPAVVGAATAAAAALGFTAAQVAHEARVLAQSEVQEAELNEVQLSVSQGEAVTRDLASGREVRFQAEGVEVIFRRDARARVEVRVRGQDKTRAELEAVGQAFCRKLAQNYAYHRVMAKLRQQHFHIEDEHVEDSGTVHIQARIYRED